MRHRFAAAALLGALAALPATAQPKDIARLASIDAPRGHRFENVSSGDIDGDGVRDLVIAASRTRGRRRELRVHLGRAGAAPYGGEPDMTFELFPDVTAVAVGDVHADEGEEIVLFTATGAFVLRDRAENERERYSQIAAAEFLWQLPHDREVIVWDAGVVDLDGDGLDDVVLPEPEGYVVAMQRRNGDGASFTRSQLVVPEDDFVGPRSRGGRRARGRARGREWSLRIGYQGSGEVKKDLLSVDEWTPAPQFVDWDADGDLDLLAQTTAALHVWTNDAGRFAIDPDLELELPIEVDRKRLLDVSFGAVTGDVDGDSRADYVLVAGDQRSDDTRAQVAVYRQQNDKRRGAGLFGERGRPSQLLVLSGFSGAPRLTDVDGDGLADLITGSARLDALDTIRAAAGGDLEVEFYIFRNERGTFARKPSASIMLPVPAEVLRKFSERLTAEFVGDLSGDGVSELLIRTDPERLRLHLVRKSNSGLSIVERPVWETRVDAKADAVVLRGNGSAGVALISNRSVLAVELGR